MLCRRLSATDKFPAIPIFNGGQPKKMRRTNFKAAAVAGVFVLVTILASWLVGSAARAQRNDYLTVPTRYETGMFSVGNGQTARVSVANTAMQEGMIVAFEIIDRQGETIAESARTRVALNQTATFDFVNPPGETRGGRAEVRARVEVEGLTNPRYTPGFIPALEVIAQNSQTLQRVDTFQPSP